MSRLVGLDLNGRCDFAARDWTVDGEDDADGMVRLIRGGTAAEVVTTRGGRIVAGPQAALAPHGRGDGWGQGLGESERRRALAAAVDSHGLDPGAAADLDAARKALARGAEAVVAAVPDHPGLAEAAQAGLIKALQTPRCPVRLLWRAVAAFLDLQGSGHIDRTALGRRFRILVHAGAGIEDQILILAPDPNHAGHCAPRRDGPGRLHPPGGLDALFARARELVRMANPGLPWARIEPARLGPRLLTGEAAPDAREVLRNRNAGWHLALAPDLRAEDLGLGSVVLPPPDAEVAATFLCTPLAPPFAQALADALAPQIGPVVPIDAGAVARGCLRAGRLIERGLPHYFDRLEPVAIAVLQGQEPAFAPLIPADAVVPANREHVSPQLSGFVWGRGKPATEFYVLKGATEVRHWRAERDTPPGRDVAVDLRIRQTPGQSWARLTVGSAEWEPLSRSPILLDWEGLAPLDLTPEEVLDKLRQPPPPVPRLIVEAAHRDLWLGADWAGEGVAAGLARDALAGQPVRPDRWRHVLARSRRHPDPPHERFWTVGTDGSLPSDLPEDVVRGFDLVLQRLADEVAAATLSRPPRDNSLMLALTWCFARCPDTVQDLILAALEAEAQERRHPLLVPSHAARVLRQGAGRAVSGAARLSRLFAYLEAAPFNTDTINALAMALTRREEAPEALTRAQVDGFLDRLGKELINRIQASDFKVRFRNTLSAIAGLFRWRRREPFALLASQDAVALRLREALVRARDSLSSLNVAQREQKLELIVAIIAFLDGEGDPDILRRIEEAGGDDTD